MPAVHETAGHRHSRRRLLHRLNRHGAFARAALVGIAAGCAAVTFRLLVSLVEEHGHGVAQHLGNHGRLGVLCVLAMGWLLGGSAGLMTESLCPEAGGSGIPHTKAVLMGMRALRPLRVICVKVAGGLLALAAGMSLGREGPTVHIGASVGLVVAKAFRAPPRTHRALLAAGAGAGLAAAFNAPLAGFLFVMEELKRELSPMTYGTALISSVSAVAVERWLLDQQPTFHLADPTPIPLQQLPALCLLGVCMALVGVSFNHLLRRGVQLRLMGLAPRSVLGGLVGAVMACLLLYWPDVTFGGIPLAQKVLAGEGGSTAWLLALCAGKLALTALCFMTGVPGGIFAPMLVMGSLSGCLLGQIGQAWSPTAFPPPAQMATVGMAAMLAAAVRAPLTGVVLIIEMTGQYSLLYALLLAGAVAYACAERLGDTPVYEALLHLDLSRGRTTEHGGEEVIDFLIEPHSSLDGRRIDELGLPDGVLAATVERGHKVIVAASGTILQSGDMLTVLAQQGTDASILIRLLEAAKAP